MTTSRPPFPLLSPLSSPSPRQTPRAALIPGLLVNMALLLGGCAAGSDAEGSSGSTDGSGGDAGATTGSGSGSGSGSGGGGASGSGGSSSAGGGGAGGGPTGVCGDGAVTAGEECDDGNANPGDRCDACQVICLAGEKKWADNHHCYAEFAVQPTTYTSALQACAAKGTYLLTITSQGEQNFVFNTVFDKAVSGPRWLALTDLAAEGTFAWQTGEPLGYTHWLAGQPDNYQDTEDCVEIAYTTGEWNDDNCAYEYYYVCEYGVTAP